MRVSFDQLPPEAKVWMYQSPDPLSDQHLQIIEQFATVFLNQWESHGIPVQGSVDVLNQQFIRVSAYTNEPSMCGRAQDAQVRLIKELEEELGVELTNRMLLIVEADEQLKTFDFHAIEQEIQNGNIRPDSPFYNALVTTKSEFDSSWKQPVRSSWLSRYFK